MYILFTISITYPPVISFFLFDSPITAIHYSFFTFFCIHLLHYLHHLSTSCIIPFPFSHPSLLSTILSSPALSLVSTLYTPTSLHHFHASSTFVLFQSPITAIDYPNPILLLIAVHLLHTFPSPFSSLNLIHLLFIAPPFIFPHPSSPPLLLSSRPLHTFW